MKKAKKQFPVMTKLDLGCGPNKKDGFRGVDCRQFDGKVDVVHDLGSDTWPFPDASVEEANCSHMIEHLTWPQRVFFFNELFRVLKPGAKCALVLPHWCSSRYYGDPTHKEPMSEFAFYYLLKSWRDANAPHTDYVCDFDATWGYTVNPALAGRHPDHVNDRIAWSKEAAQDIVATLTRRTP